MKVSLLHAILFSNVYEPSINDIVFSIYCFLSLSLKFRVLFMSNGNVNQKQQLFTAGSIQPNKNYLYTIIDLDYRYSEYWMCILNIHIEKNDITHF